MTDQSSSNRLGKLGPFLATPALGALCAIAFLRAPSGAASTTPVRNVDPPATVNPPDTSNPIYYPITKDSSVAAKDANIPPETLLREFMDRHTATDYPAAVEAALRLIAAIPDRPEGHYNLACALSKLQRIDEALAALNKAIDCGWRDLVHTNLDPDLANVRRSDGYQKVLEKLKASIEAERIAPAPLRTESSDVIADDVRTKIPAILDRYHVPGAAVALVRDGEVVWSSAFGLRDRRETQSPLTMQDRFRVRAPLHLLSLLAAQQQQDLGRAQVAKLLLQGAEIDQAACRSAEHERPERTTRRADGRATNVGMDLPLNGGPRPPNAARRSYGKDTAFGLLRLAVEMASGESFGEYCARHIFQPLSMIDSSFLPGIEGAAHVVTGHSRLGSPMQPNPVSEEAVTGGSVYTTADDLALLIRSLMKNAGHESTSAAPVAVNDQSRVLAADGSEWVESIFQVYDTLPNGLGLAFDVSKTAAGTCAQVDDMTSGTGCLMRWYPASRCGVVVLYNSATGKDAAERIAHLVLGGN